MAGFDNRTKPAESIGQDLWTKALAFEDSKGQKLIIVTVDLATMPKEMFDMVAERIMYRNHLDRAHVVINLSHTHSGPELGWPAHTARDMMLRIETYRNHVLDAMAEAAAAAVGGLRPAEISYATGKVGFSHNRRERAPTGGWVFGMDPNGPVDRTVPVVRVTGPGGKLRGALFGLSCHPSVLTYEFFVISGDYAGIAQETWEKAHPGAAAPMKPVHAPLKTAMLTTELPFAPFSLEQFEKAAKDKDDLVRAHAGAMLRQYESGRPPLPALPYTMQAFQFGKDLTLLAMNGEVVVDYCLRVKKEYGADGMIVAGYSNARPCYIPSLRVLQEGGYEARDNILMGSGLPGPFDEHVEDIVFEGIHQLMQEVGRTPLR
jgi:hypothetical protein